MLEKKLIEKEVEVTKVEKRVIEVYHYEGKNYYDTGELRVAIAKRMARVFNGFLCHATSRCDLVYDTKVDTLKRNLTYGTNACRVFGSDDIDKFIDEVKELKSIYSQVTD
tara:strand:+ start:66 stop:395 length:330 start_codon:yes stop_codon:yes gene_type:complete